jgi:cytosine/adenosine deaminase-related metal-dependent hydrolase
MNLYEWGQRVIGPAGFFIDREKAVLGTLLKGTELLRSGVTTVNDMFVHTNARSLASLGVVDALEQLGMRAVVCFGAEDVAFHNPEHTRLLSIHDIFEEHQSLFARTSKAQCIDFRLGIGTLSGQSEELLAATIALAHQQGWGIHTHLAEVREEVTLFRTRYRMTPTAYAQHHGLFDLDMIAAHCIWLTEADLTLLRQSGVHVVHNAVANMILASGVCPVPRMLAEGMNVSLGTDGAASNNNQNMFQLMKITALLHKLVALDAAALTARQVFWMATRGGAQALGLDHLIGSLEVGKHADVVLLDGNCATLAPVHDPYGQIVYSATGREVSNVWVNGQQVIQDGHVLPVDEIALAARAREAAAELIDQVQALQQFSTVQVPACT